MLYRMEMKIEFSTADDGGFDTCEEIGEVFGFLKRKKLDVGRAVLGRGDEIGYCIFGRGRVV